MNYKDINKTTSLFKELVGIREKAEVEKRSLTDTEKSKRAELMDQIEALCRKDDPSVKVPRSSDTDLRAFLWGADDDETRASTLYSGLDSDYGTRSLRNAGAYQLRGPGAKKDYRSLFGDTAGGSWNDKDIDFFRAVLSGRSHSELEKRAAMTIGTPSDGGFAIPVEYANAIHEVALENEIVMPHCFVQPMGSSELNIPAFEIGSHGTSLFGGFTASYKAEVAEMSEANPKLRDMKLIAKKLTGLLRFSNELVQDIIGGPERIIDICGQGLAWYRDKAFLKGTGAGEPLGILNASCTIAVSKEAGQAADTITYKNLTNMLSRLFSGSFKNSVWVAHPTTIPQLLTLAVDVGTGGSHIPVLKESDGKFSILTRPVIFSEKVEPLGDQGDILLADLTQYIVGLRAGMRFDLSPHRYFTTDETLARLIERHDGQPLWDEALTLQDGSTTVSPFVVLEAR